MHTDFSDQMRCTQTAVKPAVCVLFFLFHFPEDNGRFPCYNTFNTFGGLLLMEQNAMPEFENNKKRIEDLVASLNAASEAYYGGKEEIMSNYEWDMQYDELAALEAETGYILPDSPTQNVSFSEEGDVSGGQKEEHEFPALSLAKTKKVEELQKWADGRPIWLSWKLDGLTLVLTYDDGMLTKILTRGNGIVGTNITYMKDAIAGFPLTLSYRGHLVVRGEATISYTDFERINDSLEDDEEKYANPRNLASGTLSLDAKHIDKVKSRGLTFNAFTLVSTEESILSWGERMDWLEKNGFTTVDRELTDADRLPEAISRWTEKVESRVMDIPVDGLVITYDDIVYASSGSVTGHHATRGGLAFKWQDTSAVSVLDHIEWSCAASVITPVAVFDPVQLEGTTVSRASLCNLSELERLGIGENRRTTLEVIKANKIIPKVINVTSKEGTYTIPTSCPVCGAPTSITVSSSGTKTLRCTNHACPAKNLKKFERFVSRAALDIDGISSETLKDFINEHFISEFADIFHLSAFADRIREMDGYGIKSCENMLSAIEKSRDADPARVILAMSIPLIGADAAQRIIRALGWQGFLQRLDEGQGFDDIDGIGAERSNSILSWYADEKNREIFAHVLAELRIENVPPAAQQEGTCRNLTFVITGDVHIFRNRDAFKAYVEQQGGKVAGSVSGKTSFLINNDSTSSSSKNRKAHELNIPILTEDEFVSRFGGQQA